MNRKPLTRKIATVALALAATAGALTATASGASAMAGYHDTFSTWQNGPFVDVGVNFKSARSIEVKAMVSDPKGDPYCTVAMARLYKANGDQLGNTITIGAVCDRASFLPLKTITTQAGDIASVLVYTTKGTGGPSNGGAYCYRSSDRYTNGTLHACA